MSLPRNVGYTAGVFDIIHGEHVDQLRQARAGCSFLIVGVYSDDLVRERTGNAAVNPFAERLEIVRSMKSADSAIGQMVSDLYAVWQQVQFHTLFVAPPGPTAIVDPVPDELLGVVEVVELPLLRHTSSTLHEAH